MARLTCDRCERRRGDVLASAFVAGSGGAFRRLCADCERVEKDDNQPLLLEIPVDESKPAESVFDPIAQLGLFQ